jgi:hypothetical protein
MGTFFLLNLMLAVVMESYMESEILTAKEIAKDLESEKSTFDQRMKDFKISGIKGKLTGNKLAPALPAAAISKRT